MLNLGVSVEVCSWCGKPAIHQFPRTKKWCCSTSTSRCEGVKTKIGVANKETVSLSDVRTDKLCSYGCGRVAKFRARKVLCCSKFTIQCPVQRSKISKTNSKRRGAWTPQPVTNGVCDYGCGQPAKFRYRSGKLSCQSNHQACPGYRQLQSTRGKKFFAEHPDKIFRGSQSDETKAKRSKSLKLAHLADPTLLSRKVKGLLEFTSSRKGKSDIEVYGELKASHKSKKSRQSQLGRKRSDETRLKQSESSKGRVHSSESRKRISQALLAGFKNGTITLSPRAGRGKGGFRSDLGHYVRSSYEHAFGRWLMTNGIGYQYEPVKFIITVNGKEQTFSPDFLIYSLWVEIKNPYNSTNPDFLARLQAFQEQYPEEDIFIVVGDGWDRTMEVGVEQSMRENKVLLGRIQEESFHS